jgi:hypothetical protein
MTKDRPTLADTIQAAYTAAKRIIEVEKSEMLLPVFLTIDRAGRIGIIGTPLEDDEQKQALAELLRHKFKEEGVTHYVHVSECWQLVYAASEVKDGIPTIRPSDSERREEIVIFCGEDIEGNQTVSSAPILRDSNNVRSLGPLDKREEITSKNGGSIEGRFATLLSYDD